MTIELTDQERGVLVSMLEEAIREMGPEIRHTMTSTYKDDLREQRRVLQTLHDRLTGTSPH
jgi:hypothetical protein